MATSATDLLDGSRPNKGPRKQEHSILTTKRRKQKEVSSVITMGASQGGNPDQAIKSNQFNRVQEKLLGHLPFT